MTAGPDGFRDPAPNNPAASKAETLNGVLWIVGSTDRHLIQLFHPGTSARSRRVHRPRPGKHRAGLRVGAAITEGKANFLVNGQMNKSQ